MCGGEEQIALLCFFQHKNLKKNRISENGRFATAIGAMLYHAFLHTLILQYIYFIMSSCGSHAFVDMYVNKTT